MEQQSATTLSRPLLKPEQAVTVFNGTMTSPQLDHAEGLAFDEEGNLYCGGERGQIYRLSLNPIKFEQVGDTGGFCLGMAFDRAGDLFICDSKYAAVMKFTPKTGTLVKFADGARGIRMRIPNYPAFDRNGSLYVSDSYEFKEEGPGIFRFFPNGDGELWCDQPFNFANGLAFSPDGTWVYVVESFSALVSRIPIGRDGEAGRKEIFARVGRVPDGLACDESGRVYVSCHEPSAVYRVDLDGHVETIVHDDEAQYLCHPTNCAFWGTSLYTTNLGRCHISRLDIGVRGLPLPPRP